MKVNSSNIIAIDIGSSKIVGIIANIDKKGQIKIITHKMYNSLGIKAGIITDLKKATNSIIETIFALEKDYDSSVKKVKVALSGVGTKSYYINRSIKLSSQKISKQDIKKLFQKMIAEFNDRNQEVIHYFPIEFVIDNNNLVDNPIGMFGKELSCQLHVITANSGIIMNLVSCLASCQVEISSINLGIYTSALACLSDDEISLGAVIIDIGANVTSFGVFFANKLIYTGHVSIGGMDITHDIAKAFAINISTAEKLKVLYGNAVPSVFDKDMAINIEDIDPENLYHPMPTITTNQLTEIINARVNQTLMLIKSHYDKANVDHLIARRVIVTGGGSSLRGVKELINKIFNKQTRIAKPIYTEQCKSMYNPNMYSSVIGVIKYQSQNNIPFLGPDNQGMFQNIVTWIKNNI